MSLNNKGYLAVEVILASVVAVTIAIFLMEITIKLVNVTDDAYVETEILTDKALIIKNIKQQLEEDIKKGGGINEIEEINNGNDYVLDFCNNDNMPSIEFKVDGSVIKYTEYYGTELYSKQLNKNLDSNSIELNVSQTDDIDASGYLLFKITANSKFSKENFEAYIIVYNNKTC